MSSFLGASFSSFGCFVFEIWVLRFRVFGCLRRFELHSIRYRILVIALDFCCIYIGLVFIKGRPVSSVLGASFSILGASFSSFGCFVFEFWVLRFRVLGASCFGLRFRVLRFRNYLCFRRCYDHCFHFKLCHARSQDFLTFEATIFSKFLVTCLSS